MTLLKPFRALKPACVSISRILNPLSGFALPNTDIHWYFFGLELSSDSGAPLQPMIHLPSNLSIAVKVAMSLSLVQYSSSFRCPFFIHIFCIFSQERVHRDIWRVIASEIVPVCECVTLLWRSPFDNGHHFLRGWPSECHTYLRPQLWLCSDWLDAKAPPPQQQIPTQRRKFDVGSDEESRDIME